MKKWIKILFDVDDETRVPVVTDQEKRAPAVSQPEPKPEPKLSSAAAELGRRGGKARALKRQTKPGTPADALKASASQPQP